MTATSQSSKSGRQLLTELPARYRGLSPLCTIYRHKMTTSNWSYDDEAISADSDQETRLNTFEMVGAITGGTLVANGIAGMAAAAPAFTTIFGGTALGTSYVGLCKRFGRSLDPRKWNEQETSPAPVVAPQPVAEVSVPPITDRAGQELNPEYI